MNAGDPRRLAPPLGVLLALGLLLYVFPLVWNLPLIDPDEGLHAAIAREMVERADYVVPRVLGVPFLDKPIAFFFAQAASVRVLGANEFGVRLPGQLFGLLGAITTGVLAHVLAGRRAALVAGCIYATLAFPLAVNQAAVHDVALVPWTNLAFASLLLAGRTPHPTARVLGWSAVAGVWLGLAMLTKGLAGIAIVGLPMVVLTLLAGRPSWVVVAGGALGLVIGLAVAAPWYIAVERAEPGYLHYFFVQRHVMGFATTTQLHGHREWWYYLPVVVAGSAPWLVTGAAALGRVAMPDDLRTLRRVGLVWFLIDLAFLSAAGSKLATYVLPLFPAVALVVASAWLGGMVSSGAVPTSKREVGLCRAQALVGALLFPAVCAAAAWWAGVQLGPGTWVAALLVSSWWSAMWWGATRWAGRRLFAWSAFGVALVLVAVYTTVLPVVARQHTAMALAGYFNQKGVMPARLWIVDERVGSFLFYLDPSLRRALSADQVDGVSVGRALIESTAVPGTIVAFPQEAYRKIAQRADTDGLVLAHVDRYYLLNASDLRSARVRPRAR